MKNKDIEKKLQQLDAVVRVTRRIGGKVPVRIRRYHKALQSLKWWSRKGRMAQTKVKKYDRICRRYERLEIFGEPREP